MRYFFSGDTHFGHFNIIKYTNRPFKTLEEMNSTLINNWNNRVKPEDCVIHNGDFCFKNTKNMLHKGEGDLYSGSIYEKQLNGKIIFIKGSHDGNNACKTCIRSMKIKLGGYLINIVHDPLYISYNCDFNLVAHVHNLWKIKRFFKGRKFVDAFNVGVDVNDFKPITIEEILKEYIQWKKTIGYNLTKEDKYVRTP